MSRRRFAAAALATGLLATTVAATAIPEPAAAGPSCDIHIGMTTIEYELVKGHGSIGSGCSGWAVYVGIQRWVPGWGWSNVQSPKRVTGPGYDQWVTYNCAGTGTWDFRTLIRAEHSTYGTISKGSNVLDNAQC
jgi:hypothetical protein